MKLLTDLACGKPWIAITLGLLACDPAPSEAPAPPPAAPSPAPEAANEAVVLFLGDSMSAGYGLPADQAFPALLEARLDAEGLPTRVINAGVSGDTSAGGLSRLDWLLKQEPDVLVVELGGNDLLRGLPLAETEANLRGIVQGAKAAGAQVLIMGARAPETLGPDAKAAFDALYPRLAEEEGVPLVEDFLQDIVGQHALIQADGLHPTAEGHGRIADRVEPALAALVKGLPGG
ncbi:MAG: arylesterase [Alphaproteobacteria bacterium]|nr:arylesterase [Alphaproteobacteria bacterium]